MKKVFIILILLLSSNYSLTQEPLYPEEITLFTEGFSGNDTVTYTLEARGTSWANSEISTDYRIAQEVINGNTSILDHYGYRIFWEVAGYEPYAHALYKFSRN